MIKKLDIFIFKKFITTFLFTILMITMVSIAINFFENVDKLTGDAVTMKEVIFDYYLNFIPWINGLLWPLFVFLAVIFFTSRMAANSEIIAILSAGISYRRFLLPYLVTAGLIASFHWVGKNYVIPKSTKIKSIFESTYIRRSNQRALSDNVHLYLNPEEKIYIRYFRKHDSTAQNVIIETFKGGELRHIVKARKLKWKAYPNTWTMYDYEHHSLDGMNENLALYKEPKDTTLAITPEDFIRYKNQMEMLSSSELRAFIASEEARGIDTAKSFKTELHNRTSEPFTIIILTILGVTLASRKVRGGLGLNLAAGIILGAFYILLSKFSVTFATNLNLSAALGAWLPNIIFMFVALWMYFKAQK